MSDGAYEFVCTECRQRIIAIAGKEQAPFDLCATCLMQPGWFKHAELREILTHRPEDDKWRE